MNPINKSSGSTTGMGIISYFISLFEANEFVSTKHKMSDDDIAKRIAKEYPDRESAQDFMLNKAKKTINSYRYRYNAGYFTNGIPPRNLSLRYDNKGYPVNAKTGTSFLSQEKVNVLRKNHKKFREVKLRSKL